MLARKKRKWVWELPDWAGEPGVCRECECRHLQMPVLSDFLKTLSRFRFETIIVAG